MCHSRVPRDSWGPRDPTRFVQRPPVTLARAGCHAVRRGQRGGSHRSRTQQRVLEACRRALAGLHDQGVTADESERALAPLQNQVESERTTNAWWTAQRSCAHWRPAALAEIAAGLPGLRALTADDLSRAAAKYLRREATSTLILRPQSTK